MAKLLAVSAKICTWEVVTGFGAGDLSHETLEDYFRRDFPDFEGLPRFWKMVSFNSTEGRRHRYLVISPVDELDAVHARVLPRNLALYALADENMRSSGAFGNYRFGVLVEDSLYVLVFYEGRLCHWSEECGYCGNEGIKLGLERLNRFDEFLKEDPLFSQGNAFVKNTLKVLNMDYDNRKGLWWYNFKCAVRDPFWKGLHLETRRNHKGMVLSIILLLTMMVTEFFVWKRNGDGWDSLVGPSAPELSLPSANPLPSESGIRVFAKTLPPRKTDAFFATGCFRPSLEIRGIVGNRLFSGVADGKKVEKRPGDTLGKFIVKSVLRDRVVLECGGREWEVLNGKNP